MPAETTFQHPVLVREYLCDILGDKAATLDATFSFHKSYTDAPNPALNFADIGFIGVPLSVNDATAIASQAKQNLAEPEEQSGDLEGASPPGLWQLGPVTCTNPGWTRFMSEVVTEVCDALGVKEALSNPRCELADAILQQAGCSVALEVATSSNASVFATIAVILPANFAGGAVHVSDGAMSLVYEASAQPHFETSVVAWYTGVEHAIKPITSGNRLVLLYNLVHTTSSPCPTLETNSSISNRLARVLKLWKNDRSGRSPEKIIYFLEGRYQDKKLKGSTLEGADARLLKMFEALAKKHGFSLGLATAKIVLKGPADDAGYRRDQWYDRDMPSWHRRPDDLESDSDEDPDELSFVEVTSSKLEIESMVYLDGTEFAYDLEFNNDMSEMIPRNPKDKMEYKEHDEHDEQDYGSDWNGGSGGFLRRTYYRSALVIWPSQNDYCIEYDEPEGVEFACEQLLDAVQDNNVGWQEEMIAFLLPRRAAYPGQIPGVLCDIALRRKDLEMWMLIVCDTSRGVSILSLGKIQEAIEMFGFQAVKPGLENMLKNDPNNRPRFDFLKSFLGEPWTASILEQSRVNELHQEAREWAAASFPGFFKTLKTPHTAEWPVLLKMAREHGGITILQDSMLPQICLLAGQNDLVYFARETFRDRSFPASAEKAAVVSSLLQAAISKTTFYAPNMYSYSSKPSHGKGGEAAKFIKLSVELECPALAKTVVERVMDTSQWSAVQAQECAKYVMVPLVPFLADYTRDKPDLVGSLMDALRETTVRLYMDWIVAYVPRLTKADFAKVVRASLVDGDYKLLMTSVIPRLEAMTLPASAVQLVVDELQAQQARAVCASDYPGPTLEDVMFSFAQKYIADVPLEKPESVITALEWSRSRCPGRPALRVSVLQRLLESSKMTSAYYLKTLLLPLLPLLRAWGIEHGLLDTLSPVFREIALAWIVKVLGQPPTPNATLETNLATLPSRWVCSCDPCTTARAFLTTYTPGVTTKDLAGIGAKNRKHLEQKLAFHVRDMATFTMIATVPQGLQVHKNAALSAMVHWKTEHENGMKMLRDIGPSDEELQRILGSDYTHIKARLNGHATDPLSRIPAPVVSLPSTAAGSVQNHSSTNVESSVSTNPSPGSFSVSAPPLAMDVDSSLNGGPKTMPEATSTENGASGEPPAKRRKMLPVDERDVVDLT